MNNEYINKLIENCNIAKRTIPFKYFSFNESIYSDFKPVNIDKLKDIKKAIYVIKSLDLDNYELFEYMKEYKLSNQRKCPKLNFPSTTIYVGSSTTGVKKRLEQHFGFGNKNTYSLHLKWWVKGNFEITIYEYNKNIPIEILQIIEDNLAYQLKPAFGKKGGNNK